MRRFIYDLKEFYSDFHDFGLWSDERACYFLHCDSADCERVKYIREIYNYFIKTGDENIRAYVCSNHSIEQIAMLKNKNYNTFKSQITYFDNIFKEATDYEGTNILRFAIVRDSISSDEWRVLWDKLKLAIYKTADSKINRNQLLINIPSGEFNTSISSEQFNLFVELLQPYLTTQRSVAQQQLNQLTDAIGYYNYIMAEGMILSEEDKKRRNRLLKLATKMEKPNVNKEKTKEKKPERKWSRLFNKFEDEITDEDWISVTKLKSKHVQRT